MIAYEIQEKIAQYVQSCGCELYDVEFTKEFHQNVLRISIYAKEGITLDKCQEVSNVLSPFLDIEEPFDSQYLLEVSSPGVERILKTTRHFALSLGEEIAVKMLDKTSLEGILKRSDEQGFVLQTQESEIFILYSQIKKVKTILRW